MNLYDKISILGPSARYDTCGPKDFGQTTDIPGVYNAKTSNGNVCRLFKVLQTNNCLNNCNYCAFRRDRDSARTTASPDEMAKAFESAYSRRLVDGLFLSSGLDNQPDATMDKMLATANILRKQYNYRGYIHLKVMPGTSSAALDATIDIANRISLNIEAPTEESLAVLSPNKRLKSGLLHTLSLIKSKLKSRKFNGKKIPSLTTQFVVGAGIETDKELVKATKFLYDNFKLQRVFYSAFRPVSGTPLEDHEPVSITREHRLYQTDFLMRFYNFAPVEIPFDNSGFLMDSIDPKTLWANLHPEAFPVNLNTATYFELLRVPGIGPQAAQKLVKIRRESPIKSFYSLHGLRLQIDKMSRWVTV